MLTPQAKRGSERQRRPSSHSAKYSRASFGTLFISANEKAPGSPRRFSTFGGQPPPPKLLTATSVEAIPLPRLPQDSSSANSLWVRGLWTGQAETILSACFDSSAIKAWSMSRTSARYAIVGGDSNLHCINSQIASRARAFSLRSSRGRGTKGLQQPRSELVLLMVYREMSVVNAGDRKIASCCWGRDLSLVKLSTGFTIAAVLAPQSSPSK